MTAESASKKILLQSVNSSPYSGILGCEYKNTLFLFSNNSYAQEGLPGWQVSQCESLFISQLFSNVVVHHVKFLLGFLAYRENIIS